MSIEYLKSVTLEGDRIYTVYASNGTGYQEHQKLLDPVYTSLYQSSGLYAVLLVLGEEIFAGNIHPRPYPWDKIVTLLDGANQMLKAPLRNFLDKAHAGVFIATVAQRKLEDPLYNVLPDLRRLEDLRKDPQAVLAICRENPAAFNHAAESVRRSKAQAAKYVLTCAEKADFVFPSYYTNDKDIALLALRRDGRLFKYLGDSLTGDQDVVRCAFDESQPRHFHEFQPALIANELRQNSVFMTEIATICPDLQMRQTPELLQSKDLAIAWITHNNTALEELDLLPSSICSSARVQAAMFKRSGRDPDLLKQILSHLRSRSIPLRRKLASIDCSGKVAKKKASKRRTPSRSAKMVRPPRGRKRR